MCNSNVPSVTLQTAILMQVKEFSDNATTFSVHDITRSLRDKCNSGNLEIPEAEDINGGQYRFSIDHTKVHSLFNEMRKNGVFNTEYTITHNYNGRYFEYSASQNAPNPTSTSSTPSGVGNYAFTPAPVNVIAPTTNVVTPVAAPTSDSDVKNRISVYLNNCKTRNFRPTLKQVQSAIKRDTSTGWTCQEIKDYIVYSAGINVIDDPDFISDSQVAIV